MVERGPELPLQILMPIPLKILTPEWHKSLEVDAVFLPGSLGEFEVLPGHAPIISTLTAGKVKWRIAGSTETLDIKGGAARLQRGSLEVCAEI